MATKLPGQSQETVVASEHKKEASRANANVPVLSMTPEEAHGYPTLDQATCDKLTLKVTPWRRTVTPFEHILAGPYKGSGTETDPYIIDWLREDPEDPQRWGQTRKWMQILITSLATLAVALSSSAYSGGIPSLLKEFGHSVLFWTAGVSLFVLGFAMGPLIWAPASEVYGRRIIYVISYAFFTMWQAVTCAAPNAGSVLVFRCLAGLFGSSPLANAGGTVADILDATQMGLGMALFSVAPFLGPAIGPITGGFLGQAAGWRWVEGMLALFCGAIFIVILLFSAETYAPLILRQRADRLSKATGKVYRFRADAAKKFNPITLVKASLVRPWKFLFRELIVIVLSLYVAIIYGVLYLNFAAYPIVFGQGRGWSTGIQGLSFIGIMVGAIIAVLITITVSNPRYVKVITARGYPVPEDRLPPAMWGGIVIVIGLAGFAATDGPSVHWIAPIIFGVPFGCGMVVLFLATMGYLVDTYTVYAASVLAANSVLRSLFGAAFPLFTRAMYDKLGIHWAAALPGFLAFACMPFPFLFYKYGAQIRARGKYAAEAGRLFAQIMAARKAAMAPTGDDEKDVGMEPVERTRSIMEDDPMYGHPEVYTLERTMSMEEELKNPQTVPTRATSPVSARRA